MSNKSSTQTTPKSESIFQKRWNNFKKIKRAYYSLILLGFLYLLSFLAPLLVNNKPIVVSYNGGTYFPAFADLFGGILPVSYKDAAFYGQTELFGRPHQGAPHFRELKKQWKSQSTGNNNWMLMPLYPYDPVEVLSFEEAGNRGFPTPPDGQNILGTDKKGRDVFARVVYGFQISITLALIVVFFSKLIGILVCGVLGYYGGKLDIYALRFIEVFSFVPFLFMVMILVQFIKPNLFFLAMLLVILGGWIGTTYYVRAEYYREKSRDYVSAAKAMGASDFKIMYQHILPNALTPVITFIPFSIVGSITSLVGLDFLGFGLQPPTPSWGELIQQGMDDIKEYWLIMTPLVMMFFTLTTITFIGEGIRQAFDPRNYSRLR